MAKTCEIQRLCESWWEELADSTREEQQRFAEQFLRLLGWVPTKARETAIAPGQAPALTYALGEGPRPLLTAFFVTPGSLDPPGAIVQRGLDFCATTRAIVEQLRAGQGRYGFITDLFRSYLYDARSDELVLYSDSPTDFQREFGDVIPQAEVAQGALDALRRQPRSYMARQLREWAQRWTDAIGAEMRQREEAPALAIDRLFVLRTLADYGMLKRPGWPLQQRFADLILQATGPAPEGVGKRLTGLFHDIWLDWHADLFAPQPALDAALEKDHVAAPLLREFAHLSRAKFDTLTILESFNHGEAAEKARVRMVPEENEERRAYLARCTCGSVDQARIVIDLADEGYRAIFHWLDRLIAAYERLGKEFDTSSFAPVAPGEDLDLFAWSEINAARPESLGDKFRYAVEHGLVVYYTTPRQFRTARLMLYLHLLSAYQEAKVHVAQFPRVEAALQKRPRMLESDRQRIYHPQPETDWNAL